MSSDRVVVNLSAEDRGALLVFARQAIERHVAHRLAEEPPVSDEVSRLELGLFVTLRSEGSLRGCIGHIKPEGTLIDEIRSVAVAAAVRDYRFAPVTEGELDEISLEISLLTPPAAVADPRSIQLGIDGVILTVGSRSALFLPEVATEQRWSLEQTLEALCRKARLDTGAWRSSDARFEVFQTIHFGEMPVRRCDFCAFRCSIEPGRVGRCGIRRNVGGEIQTDVWGEVVAQAIDPVEKKPLYHFLPGSRTFSIALFGCNFRCSFCQNASIAHPEFRAGRAVERVSPDEMIERWVQSDTPSISFTYGEPAVWQDYLVAVATGVRERGGRTIMVSNGFYSEAATERLAGVIDAFNIDLKGGSDFYRDHCLALRRPVVDSIRSLAPRAHVEVTTMLIEGLHQEEEISRVGADLEEAGVQVWHLSRFFPAFRMSDRSATSESWLRSMVETMRDRFELPFIYAGNSRQSEYHQTRCPHCATVCIERGTRAFAVDRTNRGVCPGCGKRLFGTFA